MFSVLLATRSKDLNAADGLHEQGPFVPQTRDHEGAVSVRLLCGRSNLSLCVNTFGELASSTTRPTTGALQIIQILLGRIPLQSIGLKTQLEEAE